MRSALLLLATLALGAQDAVRAPVQIVIDPPPQGQVVTLDQASLLGDLRTLLRENGLAEAGPGTPGALKLTLRPDASRMPEGIAGLSAVAYLERPGQSKILRARIITALRNEHGLELELRQACLDVAAALLARTLPENSPLRRVLVEPPAAQGQPGEVPFQSLRVRVHPLPPLYPRLARQHGVQGHVKTRVTLGVDGRPTRADLVSGPDELALTALHTALRWAFDPVQGSQGPVEARTELDIAFSLSGGMDNPAVPTTETLGPSGIRHERMDRGEEK